VIAISLAVLNLSAEESNQLPRLERRGAVTQLVVDGKPFLLLGGELYNSSSSSLSFMQPIWPKLQAMHLNTVLAPVSWELIEPREGSFDFALVDGLIAGAREHNLRLVLLWFGSWKNTYSSYAPEWVKRDSKRFPRVLLRDGRPTERLSPFSESNRNADVAAFKTLMRHLREVDAARTVIMVQVENEVGVIPESRDFSPAANDAFRAAVPKAVMELLRAGDGKVSPELAEAWTRAGKKGSGNWEDVFGRVPMTDDVFMAWHYASYMEWVAAAGKAEYALPLLANAALIRPNYLPGQYNGGGPLPHSLDLYRAAAPHIDFYSPDIYFDNFGAWAKQYSSEHNPLLVPEAFGGGTGAANALFVFGQLNGIGFSPFGIEGSMSLTQADALEAIRAKTASSYSVLSHLSGLILAKQGTGEMVTALLEDRAQPSGRLLLGNYEMSITRGKPLSESKGDDRVAVMFIQTGADEFVVAASDQAVVSFRARMGSETAGIASIDEEALVDGKWALRRRLNGDENAQGQLLKLNESGESNPMVYKVKLYRY
jgi:hypothetical protein